MEEKNKEVSAATEAAENKQDEKKPAKVKPDKLGQLMEKQEKAAAVLKKATEKAKAIEDEIAAEKRKLHDKEIKKLDSLCKNMKINLADVIGLIQLLSDNGLAMSDITEMIGGEKRNG